MTAVLTASYPNGAGKAFVRPFQNVNLNGTGGFAAINTHKSNDGNVRVSESHAMSGDYSEVTLYVHELPKFEPIMFGLSIDTSKVRGALHLNTTVRIAALILPTAITTGPDLIRGIRSEKLEISHERISNIAKQNGVTLSMTTNLNYEVYFFISPADNVIYSEYSSLINFTEQLTKFSMGKPRDRTQVNAFKMAAMFALVARARHEEDIAGYFDHYPPVTLDTPELFHVNVPVPGHDEQKNVPSTKKVYYITNNGISAELPDGFIQGDVTIRDMAKNRIVTVSADGIPNSWLSVLLGKKDYMPDENMRILLIDQARALKRIAATYELMANAGLEDGEVVPEPPEPQEQEQEQESKSIF